MPSPAISELLSLYKFMLMSRRLDEMERQATNRGLAPFHVSGIGHEASAALAFCLGPQDWLHCHYRDKALMLARGLTPLDFFLSLLCKATSASKGRQMNAFMAASEYNVLSIVGPVGNNALQAAGIAAALRDTPGKPIVLASMGDGATQQGEVLEAIGEASRSTLPVLFLIHDNGLAISTRTAGRTFFSLPDGRQPSDFIGVPITWLDGSQPHECLTGFDRLVEEMRLSRRSQIVILKCERMDDHSNADDQRAYRSTEELESSPLSDPMANLASYLQKHGVSASKLELLDAQVTEEIASSFDEAMRAPEPTACYDTQCDGSAEDEQRQAELLLLSSADGHGDSRITMLEALRETLRANLALNDSIILYGQDIEDPKGDVFGLTRGLSSQFPDRVLNSPLSESTIVGTAIGRALAGQRPIAFIPFADFLPLAWNQISLELATMAWRTVGEFKVPVVVMAICGGYKAGLGPFHAQTNDAMAAHLPGIDVMMPSNPVDASALLDQALHSSRPTLFLYPKSLLNDRSVSASPQDLSGEHLPLGKAAFRNRGDDITLVSWGGAMASAQEAAVHAMDAGLKIDLIDLRTLAPWDKDALIESANRTGRLLVVHEDNITAGFGAEIIATVVENCTSPVKCQRVARPDTHIPFHLGNHLEILPNSRRVLAAIADLMEMDLVDPIADRTSGSADDPFTLVVNAFGISPSDDQLTIIKWHVNIGDHVIAGQPIAEVDADKASGEIDAPASGIISALLIEVGTSIRVGQPLLHLKTETPVSHNATSTLPTLRRRANAPKPSPRNSAEIRPQAYPTLEAGVQVPSIMISTPTVAPGNSVITNEELAARFPDTDAARIFEKTGIQSRPKIGPGENPFTLAWSAASQAIAQQPDLVHRVEMIICSTSSVSQVCPSIACKVLAAIQQETPDCQAQSFDILATCSGYLFALQIACDYLQQRPGASVLVLTSEVLSPLVNPEDFGSCISFGDAATATWCTTDTMENASACFRIQRPLCFSTGDPDALLTVPPLDCDRKIVMQGGAVRQLTVPAMARAVRLAAEQAHVAISEIQHVIPHQTNRRIINDLAHELGLPQERMFTNLEALGNTSSCTLPIAIRDFTNAPPASDIPIAFTTFGGGFTYAAAIGYTL